MKLTPLVFAFVTIAIPAFAPGQMVSGADMPGFHRVFGLTPKQTAAELSVVPLESSTLTNVLWPGEASTQKLLIRNRSDKARRLRGKLEVIGYRTAVPPGDIWSPRVFSTLRGETLPVSIDLGPQQSKVISVKPRIPAQYGSYGLVLDFGNEGRAWAGTVARVVRAKAGKVFTPAYAIDMPWSFEISPAVTRTFKKLGVKGCRMEASYNPTTSPNFEQSLAELATHLKWAQENDVTVMLTIGAGSAAQPLGRGRPWLTPEGVMINGLKEDLAWLPSSDEDFKKWVEIVATRYGWPNGPVNAVELWNEPWEGVSISGWGADLPRYREIYRKMGEGIFAARKKGVKVLIGGASSSSNTIDKLFPDGRDEFLPMLDFVSIHYQGVGAIPSLVPIWVNRKGPYGMVQSWDTESWVANSEDRVPGVVGSMRSFGQQRAMGTYAGNTYQATSTDFGGKNYRGVQAWSLSPAVAAAANFVGERPFKRLVFGRGLPWVYEFATASQRDDSTLIVLGDMGVIYSRDDQWFRGSQGAVAKKTGALEISDHPSFRLLDAVGNRIVAVGGKLRVPLNSTGYYLRTDGTSGSFERLLSRVKVAQIIGYPPVEIVIKDPLAPVGTPNSSLRVNLQNLTNRPSSGRLVVTVNGQPLGNIAVGEISAHRDREVFFPLRSLRPNVRNEYQVKATYISQERQVATHQETIRVNLIARRPINVDGDLADWNTVLPQNLTGDGLKASVTEQAWLPFKELTKATGGILSTGKLAYDEKGFYFAAESVDPTPYAGNIRFANRDDDSYYYPAVSKQAGGADRSFSARWKGTLTAPRTGPTTLFVQSDDGIRVRVDGKLVIDNWSSHGPTWDDANLSLSAGVPVPLEIEYFNGGGGGMLKLEWQPAGGKRELVPASALGTGLAVEYFSDTNLTSSIGKGRDTGIDRTTGKNFPDPDVTGGPNLIDLAWPDGVRRFTYRKDPDLPSGNGTDNVQIAFNVLPMSNKYLLPNPPGTFPKYMAYADTDYEYALNSVAPAHGGGTEIWRLLAPGVPRKHFYPRQPRAKVDGGPVTNGNLVITRNGNRRITEAFLPWAEIPHVKRALDQGRTIKFSFRINDDRGPAYELPTGRSVSKQNFLAFHNDWATHWANEIEFAFERP